LAAGLIVFGLSGCTDNWTWRQKITVSVSTPEGIKSASNIMQASIGDKGARWTPPEASGAKIDLIGEAVVLEAAPGRYLFALLNGMPMAYAVFFPDEAPLEIASRLESLRETRTLTPDQYPLLVTFADINDPASVRRVDPADLAASFGAGYRLGSISMTITDEPMTEGTVEAVLEWLNWPRERLLAAGNGENPVKVYGKGLVTPLGRNDFRSNR
jgi:hypothetical protein